MPVDQNFRISSGEIICGLRWSSIHQLKLTLKGEGAIASIIFKALFAYTD
jgi:hypothetical protein